MSGIRGLRALFFLTLVSAAGALFEGAPGAQVPAAPAAPRRAAPSRLTTPVAEWGHAIGEDHFLVNYQQLTGYWKKLAAESPRVHLVDIGRTSEGRTMLMAIVTSPANYQKLERYRTIAGRLATAEGLTDESAR